MAVDEESVPDVVFYGDSATGTFSELAVDDSGYATDLTEGAGNDVVYETSSSRFNLPGPRTYVFEFTTLSGSGVTEGYLMQRGVVGNASNIQLDNNATIQRIRVRVIGSTTYAITPGVWDASTDFVLSWAMEENPDATGASDAWRSEVWVYNKTSGESETHTFTHAAEDAGTSSIYFGASGSSGTGAFEGDLLSIRASKSFNSIEEIYQTYVSQSSAPTLEGEDYRQAVMPERSDVTLGDDGEFAGPVHILAARACRDHRMLLASPVINEVVQNIQWQPVTAAWRIDDPDDSDVELFLTFLRYRPLHVDVTHVHVEVYVQLDYQGAGDPDPITFYLYSMSQPGPFVTPASSPETFTKYRCSAALSTDHGTGDEAGEWLDLGKLDIARDKRGKSYFVIGADAPSVDHVWRIKAIVANPVVSFSEGQGFGGGDFG